MDLFALAIDFDGRGEFIPLLNGNNKNEHTALEAVARTAEALKSVCGIRITPIQTPITVIVLDDEQECGRSTSCALCPDFDNCGGS
jgi:hypothetical protein